MAEVTGLRNNALNYPVYGVPYGITFPMLDADGDLVTGATTPDAEVSKNGDTFADCTNESVEIATASGVYYLLLTAAEMTADVVTVIAKSATAGMKTTVITLYPRKLVTLASGTVGANAADGSTIQLAAGSSPINDYYNGCLIVATIDTVVEARMISDYVGSTLVCTIAPLFSTAAPDTTDTYVVYLPEGRQVTQSDGVGWLGQNLAAVSVAGVPEVDLTHVAGSTTSVSALASGVATLLADWLNGGRLDLILDIIAADTTTDIPALIAALQAFVDTEVAAILEDTGTTLQAELDGIQADTEDIQARLPAALTANGNMKSSLMEILTTALTETAGLLAGGFKKFFNVASPTGTLNSIPDAVPDAVGGLPVTGTRLVAIPWNAAWDAEVESEATDALNAYDPPTRAELTSDTNSILSKLLKYVQLVLRKDAAIATDNATEVTAINADGGGGGGAFASTTDSQEAIRDRGDSAWATAVGFSTHSAADVWAVATRLLTAGTNIVLAKGVGVTGFNDLSAAQVNTEADTALSDARAGYVQAIWDALTSALTTVGSIGKLLVDNINATISSRASQTSVDDLPTNAELATALGTADDAVLAQVALVKAKTDNLPSDPADESLLEAAITAAQAATIDGVLDGVRMSKNTAFSNFMFKMVSSTDHVTAVTGLTITATRSLDGAAFASCANSAAEVSGGWYKIDLAAADLNGEIVVLRFTGSGADAREIIIVLQPKD